MTTPTESTQAAIERLQSELEKTIGEHRQATSAISSMMTEHRAEMEALELEQAILQSRIEAIQNGQAPAKFVAKRVAFARAEV